MAPLPRPRTLMDPQVENVWPRSSLTHEPSFLYVSEVGRGCQSQGLYSLQAAGLPVLRHLQKDSPLVESQDTILCSPGQRQFHGGAALEKKEPENSYSSLTSGGFVPSQNHRSQDFTRKDI